MIAVHLNLQALNPLIPGSDGAGIFNEFNATDKTKQRASYIINAVNLATVALMSWAVYKTCTTR